MKSVGKYSHTVPIIVYQTDSYWAVFSPTKLKAWQVNGEWCLVVLYHIKAKAPPTYPVTKPTCLECNTNTPLYMLSHSWTDLRPISEPPLRPASQSIPFQCLCPPGGASAGTWCDGAVPRGGGGHRTCLQCPYWLPFQPATEQKTTNVNII